MKQIIFATILILAFCFVIFAQAVESKCPQMKFVLLNGSPFPEQTTIFEIKVGEDQEKQNLRYEWTFSRGKILRGQGTSKVEFLAGEEDEGANVNFSVKVIGLPKDCVDTYSDIFGIAQSPIFEPIFDLGKLKNKNNYKAVMDSLFIELNNDLSYKALIVIRFGKNDSRSYKISHLKKICEAINFRKYDITRLTFAISEGDFEERTTVWVGQSVEKLQKRYLKDGYKIIEGKDLTQKINELFPKK